MSRGGAMVVAEHSTEALAPLHRLRWRDDRVGSQELVCEAASILKAGRVVFNIKANDYRLIAVDQRIRQIRLG